MCAGEGREGKREIHTDKQREKKSQAKRKKEPQKAPQLNSTQTLALASGQGSRGKWPKDSALASTDIGALQGRLSL